MKKKQDEDIKIIAQALKAPAVPESLWYKINDSLEQRQVKSNVFNFPRVFVPAGVLLGMLLMVQVYTVQNTYRQVNNYLEEVLYANDALESTYTTTIEQLIS